MPMLYALGQHSSLVAVSDRLHHGRILNELWIATRSWVKTCGTTPRYDFTMARRQCGTVEVRSLPTLEVWREQPDSWTLRRKCGEGASTVFQKKAAS